MSKAEKKKEKSNINYTLLVVPIILIVVIIGIVCTKLVTNNSNYYKLDSRITDTKNKVIDSSENLDTVGWIKVQGTSIDIPIAFNHEDTDKYPVENDGYAWDNNLDSEFHNHMQIYGHNIFNLSSKPDVKSEDGKSFEDLMSFVYYDQAKDNKYIQLTLNGQEYIYKIFAVAFVPSAETLYYPFNDDYTKEDMKDYLNQINKHNMYDYDLDVNEDDQIITLVTCTRFFGNDDSHEFRVVGRLVRDGEKLNNYSVKKNKNYKEVEKILKGDENNEEDNV
jgi:hypothetical protein